MIQSNLKIALLPLEIVWFDKRANLDAMAKAIDALPQETDLVILPETFSTGFPSGMSREDVASLAESIDGPTMRFVKEYAHVRNMAVAGSFICRDSDDLYNRMFFAEPDGECKFADKKHLFTMAGENKIFSSGKERLHIRFRGWNIAMVTCYDLRFPAWCRNVGNAYDFLIIPANWPEVRIDAWQKLLYARAIENQCYLAGVDCCGTDNKSIVYNGSSLALDFKGKEIGDTVNHAILATLEKDALERFRSKFPAWADADNFEFTAI